MSKSATGHWMPFYWADYFGKTTSFSTEEHGAYLLLIGAYWQRGRALPDDDAYLAQCTKMSRKRWRIVRPKISEHFAILGGVWRHERVEKEILKSCQRITSAQAKADARWHPQVMQSTTTTTIEERKKKKEKATPSAQPFIIPDFIPHLAWGDFLEMRKKQRKPATEKAKALLARSLEKLMIQGHDPGAILEQSTVNGWTDVYPLKEKGNGNGRIRKQSPHELAFDVARDYCADILAAGSGSEGCSPDKVAVPLLPTRTNGGTNQGGH